MKILVVDDNKQNLAILSTVLRNGGYEVATAANGEEALNYLAQGPVDLIVSDILMPKMDGFQFCLKCRENAGLKNIPFIMTTATYTENSDEKFCRQIGADKVMSWPLEPDAILKTVKEVLDKARREGVGVDQVLDGSSAEFLKGYNQRVVKQLERKMVQLEEDITQRERTEAELKKKLDEAEIFYKAAIDREDKILELKKKLQEMEKRPGYAGE